MGTIETGDYSLPGCQQWISVERKTLDDLVGCLTKGRDRFERELKRARVIPHFCVVVESSLATVLRGDYRSQLNPKSTWESIIAFELRYRFPFHFAGDTRTAAWWAESFLLRWWKEHFEALDEARRAVKRLKKEG